MKIKTSELSGAALDWAVAKCEGWEPIDYSGKLANTWVQRRNGRGVMEYRQPLRYSTDWSQGGPLIEREKISVELKPHGYWMASYQYNYVDEKRFLTLGDTPLIAAMRCYCSAKLGDEIDIPDELLQ